MGKDNKAPCTTHTHTHDKLPPHLSQNTKMEVQWEDQQRINEFSKLNARLDDNKAEEDLLSKEKEDVDDVHMEIELVDEDEKLMYNIGDTFVYLPQSEIVERLEKKKEELDGKLEEIKTQNGKLEERLSELKSVLYARFGNSINLEKD